MGYNMFKRWFYSLQVTLVISACASPARIDKNEEFDFRLRQLESLNISYGFMIDTDRCFIDYFMCRNQKDANIKKCWGAHEACVINVYQTYEQLKKKLDR